MEMIKCKALEDFTEFVDGLGQIHGDPNNSDERVSHPEVPASRVAGLVERGKIELPAVLHHDEGDQETASFTMKHVGAGIWAISGPGLDEPEKVKGKHAAEARMAELTDAAKDQAPA